MAPFLPKISGNEKFRTTDKADMQKKFQKKSIFPKKWTGVPGSNPSMRSLEPSAYRTSLTLYN